MSRLAAAAVLALALAGCGYRVVGPSTGGGQNLSIPTSSNLTRWRGAEAELTSFLREDAQRLMDVRVGRDPADLVLRTTIVEAVRSAPIRQRSGRASLGAVDLTVTWELLDGLGQPLESGKVTRTLEFLPLEDENANQAIAEMLDSIAEYVVIEVATRLSQRAPGSTDERTTEETPQTG